MTESTVTQALMAVLKARLPGADLWKVCDRFTKGRPDICVTCGDTSWLEIKLLKKGDTFAECSDPLQQYTLQHLAKASSGRAWYVIYDMRHKQKTTSIYLPQVFQDLDRADRYLVAHAAGFDHQLVAGVINNPERRAA